jgi:hypothetical protein
MPKPPPPWQAHNAANYDGDMTPRCSALLGEIVSDPARRQGILADPRNLHRELFAPFVPPGHAEYAGAYRGTPGTALADRRMSSESQLEPDVEYEFCLPGEVSGRIGALLNNTHALLSDANTDDYGKLIGLTYTFCWFGVNRHGSLTLCPG